LQSRHRGGRGYLGLLLLAAELTQTGPVPPVTLSFILGQAALYIGLVPSMDLSLSQVCISPVWVYYRRDYLRLLLGSFYHADDWHLYYNMVSFLWKGRTLERMMGSAYFLILIAVFAPLIGCVEVALAFAAEAGMGKSHYLSDCSVGFSGVIFALKVLTTYNLPPGVSYVIGFLPVHSRLAVWAELVIIQLVTPNASLLVSALSADRVVPTVGTTRRYCPSALPSSADMSALPVGTARRHCPVVPTCRHYPSALLVGTAQ
uniref:Rhomboid domain-containing protein n=1 Tax=Macrostomum lignano TaxID=282301 RepID=A0A1I8JBE8_9PLAT